MKKILKRFLAILPYDNLVLRTEISKNEVLERLNTLVEQDSDAFKKNNTSYKSKPNFGRITDNDFNIKRAITKNNSFTPNIIGEIKDGVSKATIVHIKMRIDFLVAFVFAAWVFLASLACLFVTYLSITDKFQPVFLAPFLALFTMTIMSLYAYKMESQIAKTDLSDLLEAEYMA
jgi:hypothetical protein